MKYLLFPLYIIPWAFLGLYGDIALNTAWLYLPALAVPVLLGLYYFRNNTPGFAGAGNAMALLSSFLLTYLFRTDHWNAYFKPFGALGLLLILFLVSCFLQALIWRHYRKNSLTGAVLWFSVLFLLISPQLCQLLALI